MQTTEMYVTLDMRQTLEYIRQLELFDVDIKPQTKQEEIQW